MNTRQINLLAVPIILSVILIASTGVVLAQQPPQISADGILPSYYGLFSSDDNTSVFFPEGTQFDPVPSNIVAELTTTDFVYSVFVGDRSVAFTTDNFFDVSIFGTGTDTVPYYYASDSTVLVEIPECTFGSFDGDRLADGIDMCYDFYPPNKGTIGISTTQSGNYGLVSEGDTLPVIQLPPAVNPPPVPPVPPAVNPPPVPPVPPAVNPPPVPPVPPAVNPPPDARANPIGATVDRTLYPLAEGVVITEITVTVGTNASVDDLHTIPLEYLFGEVIPFTGNPHLDGYTLNTSTLRGSGIIGISATSVIVLYEPDGEFTITAILADGTTQTITVKIEEEANARPSAIVTGAETLTGGSPPTTPPEGTPTTPPGGTPTTPPEGTPTDTIPPQFTDFPDNTVFRTTSQTLVVRYDLPTATDNSGTVNVVCNPASGSSFSIGITTITCTATDPSGNDTTTSFNIVVRAISQETTPPQFTDFPSTTVFRTSDQTRIVQYDLPTATDNSGTVTVVCDPAPGSTFRLGIIPITCTATDPSGNSTTTSFNIVVLYDSTLPSPPDTPPQETTAPQFTYTPEFTHPIPTHVDTATVGFLKPVATASSGLVTIVCDSPREISQYETATHFFIELSIGTHTVTCTANNGAGTTETSFNIEVVRESR